MSNPIILATKLADVIMVNGKCYSFSNTTSESTTHLLSDVDGVFSDCTDCLNAIINIHPDEIIDVSTRTDNMSFYFHSSDGDSASIIVNNITFIISNNQNSFVWDVGGLGEHTFTTIYETISRTAGILSFNVVWTGTGSLLFSLENFV